MSLGFLIPSLLVSPVLPQENAKPSAPAANEGTSFIIPKARQEDSSALEIETRNVSEKLSGEELFKRVSPCVVQVQSLNKDGRVVATGTGLILSSEWYVGTSLWESQSGKSEVLARLALEFGQEPPPAVFPCVVATNFHVIRPAVRARVILGEGNSGEADWVLASDESSDLAILLASVPTPPLSHIDLVASASPVGSQVFTIGNPQGLEDTLSTGIVSGLRRIGGVDLIQTSAPISPGSSGGGLFNEFGALIGITTSSMTESQNLDFAVNAAHLLILLKSKQKSRSVDDGASVEDAVVQGGPRGILPEDSPEFLLRAFRDPRLFGEKVIAKLEEIIAASGDDWPYKFFAYYLLAEKKYAKGLLELGASEKMSSYRELMRQRVGLLEKSHALREDFAPVNLKLASGYLWLWMHPGDSENPLAPQALVMADRAVRALPRCAEAHFVRGQIYRELGDSKNALRDMKSGVELDPFDVNGVINVTGESIKAGDFDYAEQVARAFFAEMGEWGIVHYAMGLAYQRRGLFENAVSHYRKSITDDSDSLDARNRIKECEAGRRQ